MKKQYRAIKFLLLCLLLLSCQDLSAKTNKDVEIIRVDDMLLEKNLILNIKADDELTTEAAGGYSVYGSQPWKNGIMPVAFSKTVSQAQKDWFIKVAQNWSVSTGVSIIKQTNQTEYLYVDNSQSGCFSEVGASPGLIRKMNLAGTCWTEPIVLHELGHALGLMHEHQRPDRNLYISVNLNNADPSIHYAFEIFSTMNNSTPYDFYSIMHYSQYAFSNNKQPTMNTLPKYSAFQNVMGIHKISEQDRKSIAAMYARSRATNERNE